MDRVGVLNQAVCDHQSKRYRVNVVPEYNGNDQLQRTYVTPGLDQNLSLTASGSTYYYLSDALGSIRQVIDANEATQNAYDYEAFGKVYGSPTENLTQPYRFTGREWDGETSLYYYRARALDAGCGRFVCREPVFHELEPHQYTYVRNLPTTLVDSTGMLPWPLGWQHWKSVDDLTDEECQKLKVLKCIVEELGAVNQAWLDALAAAMGRGAFRRGTPRGTTTAWGQTVGTGPDLGLFDPDYMIISTSAMSDYIQFGDTVFHELYHYVWGTLSTSDLYSQEAFEHGRRARGPLAKAQQQEIDIICCPRGGGEKYTRRTNRLMEVACKCGDKSKCMTCRKGDTICGRRSGGSTH